jgi:CBS domain-containing protein
MVSHDLTQRFIDATENIKKSLERRYGRKYPGMGAALSDARSREDEVVLRHWEPLQILGKLRNTIQHHSYRGGEPIPVPREDTVLAIESIADAIARPSQIQEHMVVRPSVVAPDSTLEEASRLVIDLDLSQLPVYAQARYVGLFTTNALARWLSAAIARNPGDLQEQATTVAAVLAFAEPHEAPRFSSPTATALGVCDLLSDETAPPAVLVTTDGTPDGALQGIVTRFDVPGIVRRVTIQYP